MATLDFTPLSLPTGGFDRLSLLLCYRLKRGGDPP